MIIFILSVFALLGLIGIVVLACWVMRNPDQAKREADRLGGQAGDAYDKLTKKNEGQ